jgi:CHAD domain-containing protein
MSNPEPIETLNPDKPSKKTLKPSKVIRIYGAAEMLTHLNAITKETSGIYRADDIEYVHRMRVGSRRMRTALNAFEPYFTKKRIQSWNKTIRRITQFLASARDADVQLATLNQFYEELEDRRLRTGINRLILRLTQQRQKMQARLAKQLKNIQQQKSLAEIRDALRPLARGKTKISAYPPEMYHRAEETIIYQLDILLYHQHFISQPERVKELHDMRLIAKELRYLMETFNPIYTDQLSPFIRTARETQEMVGQIRDCDVWLQYLPKFLKAEHKKNLEFQGSVTAYRRLVPGIQYFQKVKQEEREERYAQFLSAWQGWAKEEQWEKLRQVLGDYPLELTDLV